MNRAIKDEDLTHRVALYRSKYNYITVSDMSTWIEENEDYVRVSEPIDVRFVALPDDVILKSRVNALDKEIAKTRAELNRRIEDLTDQKNRLLAITHQPEEDDD